MITSHKTLHNIKAQIQNYKIKSNSKFKNEIWNLEFASLPLKLKQKFGISLT